MRGMRDVLESSFSSGSKYALPLDLVRQLIFLLRARSAGVRTVVAHFAGYHTILPVLLGFRTHIIIAGSDACSFPGINYGSFRKAGMRLAISYSLRNACTILPVHASLVRFQNTFSDLGPAEQGYAHFVRGLQVPSVPIPYGFNTTFWAPLLLERHPLSVLCVAFGASAGNAVHFRKGVDLILTAAIAMPDHSFTVIGAENLRSYSSGPANVQFLGVLDPAELRNAYATHSIYAQLSVMEGFPNALCEAMLMGCIPLVSNITSMPDIVGEAGLVIRARHGPLLIAAIQEVDSWDEATVQRTRIAARGRVAGCTMDLRIEHLIAVIQKDAGAR